MSIFKETYMIIVLSYLLIVNITAFAFYGADKHKAKKGKWRISENTLLLVAVIGGSIGAIAGMKIFHHKTQKPNFKVGLPLILILQILIVVGMFLLRHFSII